MRKRLLLVLPTATVVLALVAWFTWLHTSTPQAQGVWIPNYNAPLHISTDVSGDQREYLKNQLIAVQAALNATTTDYNAWIALGVVRKGAGDYKGAEEVWQYTANRWPSGTVSFNNLGDIYMNYLKDFPKAEENYERLIVLQPDNIDAYQNLYTLYHYFYKTDTSAAGDILMQGLKANPDNADLLALQAQLKAGK